MNDTIKSNLTGADVQELLWDHQQKKIEDLETNGINITGQNIQLYIGNLEYLANLF